MLAIRPFEFIPAHRRVTQKKSPKAAVSQSLDQIAQREIRIAISFTCESQNRIWSSFHSAVNQPRKMDSQKWKFRIGYWVDEVSDQMLSLSPQFVILSSERHDFGRIMCARHPA